jgi:transposase
MIMIGADSHKRTHTVVAVDEVGRRIGEKTVRTNTEGHMDLLAWSRRVAEEVVPGASVVWALEDCRHLPDAWRPTCWPAAAAWYGSRPG